MPACRSTPSPLLRPRPPRPLAGRVALVTGGGSGIGLGIARALADAGCAVALAAVVLRWSRREVALPEEGDEASSPPDPIEPDEAARLRAMVNRELEELGE